MGKVVQVSRREELLGLDAIYGLSALLRSLGLPRRKVFDWLADVVFGWIADGGVILDGEGREIQITPDLIDEAHGEDGSCKWISDVQRRSPDAPRRRSRSAMLIRLQLYDAASRITTGRGIVDLGKEEGATTPVRVCPANVWLSSCH